jgi:hypothetical protein
MEKDSPQESNTFGAKSAKKACPNNNVVRMCANHPVTKNNDHEINKRAHVAFYWIFIALWAISKKQRSCSLQVVGGCLQHLHITHVTRIAYITHITHITAGP